MCKCDKCENCAEVRRVNLLVWAWHKRRVIASLAALALASGAAGAWNCAPGQIDSPDGCVTPIPVRHPDQPNPHRNPGKPITPIQSTANAQQSQSQSQKAASTSAAAAQSTATAQGGTASATGGAGGVARANSAGGSATQTQSAENAGNAQSITETSPRQAVMAWSAATNTTAPCERDQHAGIGAVIGGLSFGHSTRDHDCAREHIAADLYAHGNVLAAEMVYCAISEVKAALGADCLKILRESEPVATPAPDAVTHAELQEAERRMTAHGVSK